MTNEQRVREKVREKLQVAFSHKFGSSAKRLHEKIGFDQEGNQLVSERTLRNVLKKQDLFDSARDTTLNILCEELCEKSYIELLSEIAEDAPEAIEEIEESTSIDNKSSWIASYKEEFLKANGTARIPGMSYGKDLLSVSTDPLVFDTVVKRMKINVGELAAEVSGISLDRLSFWSQINQGNKISFATAVRKFKHLQVWGSAGSGKTTGLKLVGLDLVKEFDLTDENSLLPLFIDLNTFCKEEKYRQEGEDLRAYIIRSFCRHLKIDEEDAEGIQEAQYLIQNLWKQGRCIFLIDGLDEVPSQDISRLDSLISFLVRDFPENSFVLCCRFGAPRSVPAPDFREIEMVDLDGDRIEQYVRKFFDSDREVEERSKKESARLFLQALESNDRMRELARTPLLLAVMCQLYQNGYEFPKDQRALFADAIELFIRKWDSEKRVTRDPISLTREPVPHNLRSRTDISLRNRKALLARIACAGFSGARVQHAWEREELEEIVRDFIINVQGYKPEKKDLDSRAVLRAIEAQNGLLISLGSTAYTFSHLSFQEYLAAEALKEEVEIMDILDKIDANIKDPKWYSVIQNLIAALRKPQDTAMALKRIFFHTQESIRQVPELQKWLHWLDSMTKKADVGTPSWRSCIAAYDYNTDLNSDPDSVPNTVKENAVPIAYKLRETNLSLYDTKARTPLCEFQLSLAFLLTRARNFSKGKSENIGYISEFDDSLQNEGIEGFDETFDKIIEIARTALIDNPEVQESLAELVRLRQSRPSSLKDAANWLGWANRLSSHMQKNYGTGGGEKLSADAQKALAEYNQLNLLLAECLQNDIYCSRADRELIFNYLFLPYDSLPEELTAA
ncbi:MAG: NACHT domain-containing protein [Geitlerinemataceae cyanobacterium]